MLVDRYHLFGMLYQVASTKTYISQPLWAHPVRFGRATG